MNIGFDARLYGLENAGIGRYVTNLIDELVKLDRKNTYYLFLKPQYAAIHQDKTNVIPVVTSIPHYSLSEQILLLPIVNRCPLDLLHVPHFNAPLFYSGKLILTIHDLIKHFFT